MSKSTAVPDMIQSLDETTTYQAGIIQATMHRKLQKFCDDVLEPYGITKVQWLIIGTVFDHRASGIRVSDLATIVGTNLPYMTNTINTLEHKKILKRVDNQLDNRSSFITISPGFLPKCKKIEATLRDELRKHVYADISPDDFRTYIKVLGILASR